MSVELAQSAGFCFGVDRAVSTVYRLLEEGKPAATLGPIIHNPQLVADLAARGVRAVSSPEGRVTETAFSRSWPYSLCRG